MPLVVLRGEGCELQCGGAPEAQRIIGQEGLRFPGTSQRLLLFPPRPFRQTYWRTVLLSNWHLSQTERLTGGSCERRMEA